MRGTAKASWLLAAWLSAADVAAADATPYGAIVAVDDAEMLTAAPEPARMRLRGGFLVYSDAAEAYVGRRGSVELVCPDGFDVECRAQWAEIVAARARGECIAMGWPVVPPTPGIAPMPWPRRALETRKADDPLCVRARETVAQPAEPSKSVDEPPSPKSGSKSGVKGEVKSGYGGYLLLNDAFSYATALLYVGIPGYFVAGPILHIARGHPGRAAISLGMRVALPALGLLADRHLSQCDSAAPVCIPWGIGVGLLLATVLDAAVLGGESATVTVTSAGTVGAVVRF